MNVDARMEKALKMAPEGARSDVVRGGPAGSVDRAGGMYGAGLISGVSAITRGEALGHGMWIDGEMLNGVAGELQAAGEKGVKARFTHPGLSSDGFGKVLGRFTGGEVVGDKVLGELHFLESAHATPDGDLAGYVMDMAEESPDLFGTSIVFEQDFAAVDDFTLDHMDEDGAFRSPDAGNADNLPHARIASLRAVDAVDEPAANPDGAFAALGAGSLENFGELLGYALGVVAGTPQVPEWMPVHPERLRGFAQRWLKQEGLRVERDSNLDLLDEGSQDSGESITFTMKLFEWLGLSKATEGSEGTEGTEGTEESRFDVAGVDLEELEASLGEAKTEIERLHAEHAGALAVKEEKIEALETAVESSAQALADKDVEIESLTAAHAEAIETLEAKVVAESESAEAKANETLAAAGHPPVDVSKAEDDDGKTREERILEEYAALPRGDERVKFRRANKDIFPNG